MRYRRVQGFAAPPSRRPWPLALAAPLVAMLAFLGIFGFLGFSVPVSMASGPSISVIPAQPTPGQQVTVRGVGFCPAPCSPVSISVDGSVAVPNVAVSSAGAFSVAVGLTPVSGISTIVATQTDGSGTREATAIVHIVPNDLPPSPSAGATPVPTAAPPHDTPAPSGASSPPASSAPTPQPPAATDSGSPLAPSGSPQLSVIPPQPIPGQQVTVRGVGFCPAPCSPVTLTVDGSVAMSGVVVGADGAFSADIGLTPVSGAASIVASQTDAAGATREATALITVVAADQTAGPPASPSAEASATPAGPTAVPPAGEGSGTSWLPIVLLGVVVIVAIAGFAAYNSRRGPS